MNAIFSEVLHNFSVATLILLQTMMTRFGNTLIIDKFDIIDKSKK